MNLSYLNLHTSYEYNLLDYNKADLVEPEKTNYIIKETIKYTGACYHMFFNNLPNYLKSNCEIKIWIYTTPEKNLKESWNNYMMITMEEFLEYVEYLKTIAPFDYEIEQSKGLMILKLKLYGNTHFENKWIVSSIRNVYEFPQSWALKEAIELKKMGFFNDDDNIINAVNTVLRPKVLSFFDQYVCRFAPGSGPKKMSTDQVRDNLHLLKLKPKSALNDIYPTLQYDEEVVKFISKVNSKFIAYLCNIFRDKEEDVFNKDNLAIRYKLIYKKLYK